MNAVTVGLGGTKRPSKDRLIDQPVEKHDLFELWWQSRLLKVHVRVRAEEFWDSATASIVADKATTTIRSWIDQGSIKAVPNGETWRIQVSSLKEYLRNRYTTKCR